MKFKVAFLLLQTLFQHSAVFSTQIAQALEWQAEPNWSARYRSASTAPRFHIEQIKDFSDIPEEQIQGWSEKGRYIAPNEMRPFLMKDIYDSFKSHKTGDEVIEKKALISVGSFRSLFAAIASDYFYFILLDVDPTTVQFNKANLKLIIDLKKTGLSSKQQRLLYLSIVLNRPAWIVENKHPVEWSDIQKKLFEYSHDSHDQRLEIESLPQDIQDAAKAILDLNINEDCPYSKSEHRETMLGYFRALHSYSRNIKVLYWASDHAWEKLQLVIEEDRIKVINGNIAGETTLKAIGKMLRHKNILVDAFDFSNALFKLLSTDLKNKVLPNLQSLPLSPDFKLIFTAAVIQPEVLPESLYEDWLYCVCSKHSKNISETTISSFFESDSLNIKWIDLNQKLLKQHWLNDWNTYQRAIDFSNEALIPSSVDSE